ncbi:hypothetical protein ACEPAG_4355 [Sanghuangporus baumii]
MSPLAPSESVDAFLSWLAQPTNTVVAPGHGHAHTHAGHSHNHNHHTSRAHGGLGYVPQKGKVSSSEQQQQEYAARLRELARSPLEEMAKPLLVGGPIMPPRAQSEGMTNGHESENGNGHRRGHGPGHRKDGKEKEKKRERRRSTGDGGGGGKNGATPASAAATASAAKVAPQTVKAQ